MKAERIEEPTEPGWYRARWKPEREWGCVRIDVVRDGEVRVWVPLLGQWAPLSEVAEWGESIDAVFAERDRLHEFYAEAAYRTGIQYLAEGHNAAPGPMPDVLRAISETSAERDRLATEVAELREQRDAARRGLAVAEATLSRIDDDDLPACDEHDYRHAASGMYGDAEADRLFPRPAAPEGPTT